MTQIPIKLALPNLPSIANEGENKENSNEIYTVTLAEHGMAKEG